MVLADSPIVELRQQLLSGEIQANDIIDSLEQVITARNDQIGAYLSRDLSRARSAAQSANLDLPLGGIPIAIKDNINVRGESCTCASRLMASGYTAPYDATVIRRLLAAGAIPFGRLNMDEFAMGSTTENSAFYPTRNPHDLARSPGGSSGGSAAAVAAGMAVAALGTDTGGSIRQPASHCGVIGLKPTYGRVSRYGAVAYASSLDQIGPLARTAADAALILQAIAGHDPADSMSLDAPIPDYSAACKMGVEGLVLGLPVECLGDGIDPAVRGCIMQAANFLSQAGANVVEVSLPHTEYAVAAYYILATAEASSNLSRFDGIRYGKRGTPRGTLDELYENTRCQGFGAEVKRRIILGTFVLSSGEYENFFVKAQKARTLIRQDFETAFQKVDAILTPVSPTPAPRLNASEEDPLVQYLSDILTIPPSLAGCCAISVPSGMVSSDAGSMLPVGAQIIAPPLAEPVLFRIAGCLESGFHSPTAH